MDYYREMNELRKNSGALFPGRLSVLVADDNIAIRQIIGEILELVGCDIFLATDGRDVMEALEKEHFDLILMDLQMPVMDGFETSFYIRTLERKTGEHIPILAMTGYPLENSRDQCIRYGMDDCLEKPFHIRDLCVAVERLTHVHFCQTWADKI